MKMVTNLKVSNTNLDKLTTVVKPIVTKGEEVEIKNETTEELKIKNLKVRDLAITGTCLITGGCTYGILRNNNLNIFDIFLIAGAVSVGIQTIEEAILIKKPNFFKD